MLLSSLSDLNRSLFEDLITSCQDGLVFTVSAVFSWPILVFAPRDFYVFNVYVPVHQPRVRKKKDIKVRVLSEQKYHLCQGQVGDPKSNHNRLIKNNITSVMSRTPALLLRLRFS